MIIKKTILTFLFFANALVFSQDIHWSQYMQNPIFLNPGLTGNFDGNFRFVGNGRWQWKSVTVPYQTINITADSRGLGLPNLGLGVMFFYDVAGDSKLSTIEFMVSGAYSLNLSKDSVHRIMPGIQFGLNYRQINYENLKFDSQYNGFYYDPSLANGEIFPTMKKANFNLNVGFVYTWEVNQRKKINVGVSLHNMTRPDQSFFQVKEIRREFRTTVFAEGQFRVADKWDVLPSLYFGAQGKYLEIIFGGWGRYILKQEKGEYMGLFAGVWYRALDAGSIGVGFEWNTLWAGLTYDLNFSKLTVASNARGGIEFSLRYILKYHKPKNVLYRICPEYI
ncbi:MAG: PorP/SprF family type IX secretion system membrane protein [Crocinitomicaceae bacterium]